MPQKNRKKPIFIMTIGIPGSGKTHWVRNNIPNNKFNIVCPDLIRKEVTGRISDVSQDDLVWDIAKNRVTDALKKGMNVVLDATNVNQKDRRKFVKTLPPHQLFAKRFEVSPKTAKKRIQKDIESQKDRSHVPQDVVDSMHEQFVRSCSAEDLHEEGFQLIEGIEQILP
ncbi:MAG: ATP-binding protein [Promethearchaeia archaeon]